MRGSARTLGRIRTVAFSPSLRSWRRSKLRLRGHGLSVDFFVPVRDGKGQSVPLPTNLTDKLVYDVEFNSEGQYGDYTLD